MVYNKDFGVWQLRNLSIRMTIDIQCLRIEGN